MRSDLLKNRILYRRLETNRYLCTIVQNKMGINKLKVVLTEEAQAFLDAQPFKAQQKIYYNIFKVEEGVMKVDIFKKLENTEIWEFRTLYNGICYRLFSFWDTEEETLVIATHGIVKKTQKTPLNPNRSLEIFSCKKSDCSRQYHRYSICILTQCASFILF